jgi:phosphoglycolate phosphatase-like HAD superfamily hydrolase
MSRAILFWDIDGTLLTTARAGVFALEEAAAEICGVRPDLGSLRTSGLTDSEVATLAIEASGEHPTPSTVSAFLRSYERHLPDRLHLPDVECLLLTGNTRAGAEAKLRHYGLAHYFADGAFCEDGDDRTAIARRARALIPRYSDDAGDPATFVIGDTPHDVRCGQAIGARTIAIASGVHGADELAEAWLLLEALPPPRQFYDLLGISAAT